jgi:hypothetical protein
MNTWHPPIIGTCATGHEHGDEPPAWIAEAGYMVHFGHGFHAAENGAGHPGFKGFRKDQVIPGVDIYALIHLISTPSGRSKRWHSYEIWTKESSGAVSHFVGMMDTGDPATTRVTRLAGDPGFRPLVLTVDKASWDANIRCEQWYTFSAPWSWDTGWTICEPMYLVTDAEKAGNIDPSTWVTTGTTTKGGDRTFLAFYLAGRGRTGRFWTTQFGAEVSGPTDPICSSSAPDGTKIYCLEQVVSPTLPSINEHLFKSFPTPGVVAPN